MYYAMIIVAVIMFGGTLSLNDVYKNIRKENGIKLSLELSFFGAIFGSLVLAIINCFSFENGLSFSLSGLLITFTPFTLLMAFCATLIAFGFTYCSFKALDSANLSLLSMFAMVGGMVVPSIFGIIFYGEQITVAKIVCLIFIVCAFIPTLSSNSRQSQTKKSAWLYYIGVFLVNGMSGVVSSIFTASTYPKANNTEYSLWIGITSMIAFGIPLLIMTLKDKNPDRQPFKLKFVGVSGAYGVLNRVANFLLVVALASGIDASVQYPLVTGGTMIVSTVLCYFSKKKPTVKDVISIGLAFLGTLALFVIPI